MADSKISALTDGGNLRSADQVAINRGGTSFRAVALQDGWIDDAAETWTYVSATSFKVSGTDVTAKYTPGTRIKLTQTTVKYFVVASSTFSTDTTITITGGTDYTLANAAISVNFHSYAANPQGYPGWFNFSVPTTGWSSTTKNKGVFCVNGRMVFIQVIVQGTSNATSVVITLPITTASGLSDIDGSCRLQDNGTFQAGPGLVEIGASGGATSTLNCYKDGAGAGWTASGTKEVSFEIFYPI